MTIDLLILDFDGIILESVRIKSDAFRELFSFSPDHVDEIVKFHQKNGGMSRYEKFRYYYENILNEELTDKCFSYLSNRFSELVFNSVMNVPYVAGAEEFLKWTKGRLPVYVVSATPEYELLQIVNSRRMSEYFIKVCGAPVSKSDNIKKILASTGVSPESVLFVGDAINDWKASQETGVRFIGRAYDAVPDMLTGLSGVELVIGDLNDLKEYVEKVMQ